MNDQHRNRRTQHTELDTRPFKIGQTAPLKIHRNKRKIYTDHIPQRVLQLKSCNTVHIYMCFDYNYLACVTFVCIVLLYFVIYNMLLLIILLQFCCCMQQHQVSNAVQRFARVMQPSYTAKGIHKPSHSVTCHPAEVTFPPLPQPKLVLNFFDPGRMPG